MKRTFTLTCLLATLAGPALADTPLPPAVPSNCSELAQARAQAREASARQAYDVFDLDGENARAFEREQEVPVKNQADHLTIMVNPKTGRAAALVSDGPGCTFQSVFVVLTPPYTTPLDGALDVLRFAR